MDHSFTARHLYISTAFDRVIMQVVFCADAAHVNAVRVGNRSAVPRQVCAEPVPGQWRMG